MGAGVQPTEALRLQQELVSSHKLVAHLKIELEAANGKIDILRWAPDCVMPACPLEFTACYMQASVLLLGLAGSTAFSLPRKDTLGTLSA